MTQSRILLAACAGSLMGNGMDATICAHAFGDVAGCIGRIVSVIGDDDLIAGLPLDGAQYRVDPLGRVAYEGEGVGGCAEESRHFAARFARASSM